MNYRSDIDGLRSLAIIPVVMFHAGFSSASGGFIGVDVFFVISGYLITSLLLKEFHQNSFSILKFYERRARRILPALIVLIFVTIIIGYFILLPSEYEKLARSSVTSVLFSANIYFWLTTGYFEIEAAATPLLHMWSLGVEEQYYIIFPIIVYFVLRCFSSVYLFIIVLFIFLLSLFLCVTLIDVNSTFTFYMLPTRAWEILAGSLLAFKLLPKMNNSYVINTLSLLGLTLIISGVLLIEEGDSFPGYLAIVPVLGAALIIHAGDTKTGFVYKLLSTKFLVYIGLISYSLYLWHWPITVYLNILIDSSYSKYAIVFVSFIAAIISYHFIEQPFRKNKVNRNSRDVLLLSLLAIVVVIAISIMLIVLDGFRGRFSQNILEIYESKSYFHNERECHFKTLQQINNNEYCRFGDLDKDPSVALVGDSHADAIRPAIEKALIKRKLSGIQLTSPGCRPLAGVRKLGQNKCKDFTRASLEIIKKDKNIKTVFLHGYWGVVYEGHGYRDKDFKAEHISQLKGKEYENTEIFSLGLKLSIDELTKSGKKVYIIGSVPVVELNVPRELAQKKYLKKSYDNILEINMEKSPVDVFMEGYIKALKSDAVNYIDLYSLICPLNRCVLINDDVPTYRDGDHITSDTALSVYKVFEDALN